MSRRAEKQEITPQKSNLEDLYDLPLNILSYFTQYCDAVKIDKGYAIRQS